MTLPRPPESTLLSDVARMLRALFGPTAVNLALLSTLTEDAPRSMIAGGFSVFDAGDNELAVVWDAYAELGINTLDQFDNPVLLLSSGDTVELRTPDHYAAALEQRPDLITQINSLLTEDDTPFDLIQALNHLSSTQAVGWHRLALPQEDSAPREHTGAQAQPERQPPCPGPARV